MQYGLPDHDILSIQSVLHHFPEVDQAILYGSRAKGNFKNGSDIDIALKGDGLDLSVLALIASQIDDLPLPYKVDLFIYNKIKNKELVDHIDRVGKKLFIKR